MQALHFRAVLYDQGKREGNVGLGLATVYGIVKQSDGYIWVYSEPGEGTSFKIYLPRIEEVGKATALDRTPDAAALPRGFETVLLVEDENGVRELARQYLETSGYKVIEASNGNEAMELAANFKEPIHLLMTDVVMPGISGRELADRLSVIRPDIRILFMSGYTGAKPLCITELWQRTRSCFKSPSLLARSRQSCARFLLLSLCGNLPALARKFLDVCCS